MIPFPAQPAALAPVSVTKPQRPVSSLLMKLLAALSLTLLVTFAANAQTPASISSPANSTTDLLESTEKTKTTTEQQLQTEEEAVRQATESLSLLNQLYSEGLIARVDVEKAEQEVEGAKAKVEEVQKQIADSAHLITNLKKAQGTAKLEASKMKQLTKPTSMRVNSTGAIIRSRGGAWSLSNLSLVQQFFANAFGRQLPTSTIGQSATHNRLGWNHRHAVDVGLHPDSAEGRAIINFLQSANIPFLAFRSAIPGVSTGPHIHIGNPSQKLS